MEGELLESDVIKHKKRSPLYGFLSLFLAVALFLLSLHGYFYIIHPEPVNIPNINQIQSFLTEDIKDKSFSSVSQYNIQVSINSTQDTTKQIANFIAANSCKKADRVCQSKAIFYFVRDNMRYVSDEKSRDNFANPLVTLKTGGADCEDMAVLLIALEKAIGNEVRLVFVPGHAFAQIRIPQYKGEKWINLEATCKTCKFGELPDKSALQKKTYYEL